MRILIVGAGAVGGLFGARLARAGRNVTFLVRPQRAAALRRDGLQVLSPLGDFTIQPALVEPGPIDTPFDLILLAVKAYAFDSAVRDLTPAVGPGTTILPLLNGMRHLDELALRFGAETVVGGLCLLASQLDEGGRIVQSAPLQTLRFGELAGGPSARLDRLAATLGGAGFETDPSASIRQAMWEKWIMLATLGAINCLMRGTIGDVAAAPGGPALANAILDEALCVAAAAGFGPAAPYIARTRAAMTMAGANHTSSMYRDLIAGRPVEADQILGDLCTRGETLTVPTPLLQAAYTNLCVYSRSARIKSFSVTPG